MSRTLALLFASALVTASAAHAASDRGDQGERAAEPANKMICKRFIRTGSLVDGYRSCKTKSEWERERANIRDLAVADSCRDRANGGSLCQ